MSSNTISNVTAALSAMTPSSIGVNNASQGTNSDQTQNKEISASAFGKYNKQMLTLNYLNRGKVTNPKTNNPTGPESNGDNQNSEERIPVNSGQLVVDNQSKDKEDSRREKEVSRKELEAEFCNIFGTSAKLPKFSENNVDTSNIPDLDEASFTRAVNLLNKIKERRNQPPKPNDVVDLTGFRKDSTPLISKTHSFMKSFKLQDSTFSEGGVSFDFSMTPDAKSLSLPLFFHKNMQMLQGQLPLTIFNRTWQQSASDNHVEYKNSEKELEKYKGHPFPGEWTQSRFEWGENMDNFISMLRDDYKFPGFADAMEAHKRNVIRIFKEQRSWVIAFKYDLTIRKSTFAIRNPDQKVPNPSLEPSGLVNEIFYNARAQDDLNTYDNPYMKGGDKFGRNPYSDLLTDYVGQQSNSNHSRNSSSGSRGYYDKRDRSFKSSGPYGNYKGKNYNPNFKRNSDNKGNGKGKPDM